MTSAPASRPALYAAFLRGINVGGHRRIKMDALKKAFESLGFNRVQTVLASGNVVFEAPSASAGALTKQLEKALKETFGFEIGVLTRSIQELRRLDNAEPFHGITVTPRTRLFVTFLTEKAARRLKLPYVAPGGHFKILRASENEVCSVLTLTDLRRGMHFMAFLDKEFGPRITTRSWGTITRILDAAR
jgi:uncharacterized protein (DUF1697 family)